MKSLELQLNSLLPLRKFITIHYICNTAMSLRLNKYLLISTGNRLMGEKKTLNPTISCSLVKCLIASASFEFSQDIIHVKLDRAFADE
jgi:hypothetical protein